MEIILIRHTTPDVEKGICYGQADVRVKETFLQEADAVLPLLPPDVSTIYTSPLSRCVRLAEHLGRSRKLPVVRDDRLKELNFGPWELQPWDSIDPSSLKPWMDNYVDTACPGGESYRQLADRANSFLADIRRAPHAKVLVVTHHGVIKAMSACLLNITLEKAMSMSFGYGSLTRYT
jgi:alpha-ribazole phosphatase